jgi:CubicO group peptidase (beta-lactamase class C family)
MQLTNHTKRIKISGLLLFAFLLSLSTHTLSQTYEEAGRKIDSLFASYNSQTPGVAIAIVKDGKVIFKKGYGMADLNHGIPITPQTVFNIASVSKQFTAFSIYLLENEGKLSFEDDARKYIPELPDYGPVIKIKHLLAHTSGLRDQAALLALAGVHSGDVVTTEQVLKLVARQKNLNYAPGTTFNYNNTGYTLLAEIVKRISGKTFAEYTHDNIFQPLGMTSTRFSDNHEMIVKNKAESYERINNEYYQKPLNVSNPGPSNLLTTVEDLSKWVLNFEKPIVGNTKLIKAFNEPSYYDNKKKVVLRVIDGTDTIFHAKGQNVSDYKGVLMIGHGGHTAAFRTYLGRFPDQLLSIIALSNDEHNENLRARWQIADFYIKEHLQEKEDSRLNPRKTSPAPIVNYRFNLKDFEGEYYNDELSTSYSFTVKGNKLIMRHIRLSDLELNRVGDNKFSGSGDQAFPFEMEFLRNKMSRVTGFVISNFGVKNLKFTRVK